MPAALAEHDAILRQVLMSNGGQVVKSTGDGLHAVFNLAIEGVRAMTLEEVVSIALGDGND